MCECCLYFSQKKHGLSLECNSCKPFGKNFFKDAQKKCEMYNDKEFKFTVGEQVTVVRLIKPGEKYDGTCGVTNSMQDLSGTKVTISNRFFNYLGKKRYKILEDNGACVWAESMFE